MQMGVIGLNTVPTARMDDAGDIRLGVSVSDPYMHGFMGVQVMDPLYVQIRQSAEVSDLSSEERDLFPGVDLKLRLMKEARVKPVVVVGLQSATGHKRMAGEYFALSKKYKSFDFTGGIGWGLYGSAGHFKNPFRILGSHFTKDRALDGDEPNSVEDWFTGEQIGLFGGVEYDTPVKGLSLKFDYGADEYRAEQISDTGFDAPARWSAGVNYQPVPWADLSLGILGGTLSLSKAFKNGASLEAFASVTNRSDFNIFGGTTSGHHGIRFRLPLGGYKYAPRNSAITTRIEPFGKDIAQKINMDETLYELTNPLSLSHIQNHWDDVNE